MSNFYLSKNFTKPGEVIEIKGDCIGSGTTFSSSDNKIAIVTSQTWVTAVWIGELKISEIWIDCENSSTWILLTSTEDWNPFFMNIHDYQEYTTYELIFVFFLLFIAFLLRFAKRTY